MGHFPMHWEDSGRVKPPGGTETDREYAPLEPGRYVNLPFPGGVDVGGGCAVGGDLRLLPSEHCHTMYSNKYHCGPVSGGGAAAKSYGIEVVVVIGVTRYIGDMGGGLGGVGRNGLGGAVRRRRRRRRSKKQITKAKNIEHSF